MKKEHIVANIADVVVTWLRRIADLGTVKKTVESLCDLLIRSRYKGMLKAWFEGMCYFLELVIYFLLVCLFLCFFTLIHGTFAQF